MSWTLCNFSGILKMQSSVMNARIILQVPPQRDQYFRLQPQFFSEDRQHDYTQPD